MPLLVFKGKGMIKSMKKRAKFVLYIFVCVCLVCVTAVLFGCNTDTSGKAEKFLRNVFTIDEILPFEPTETAISTRYESAKSMMTEDAYTRSLRNRDLLVAWAYSTNKNCTLKVEDITEVEPVYGSGTQRFSVTIKGIDTITTIVDLRFDDNGSIEYFQPDRALISD